MRRRPTTDNMTVRSKTRKSWIRTRLRRHVGPSDAPPTRLYYCNRRWLCNCLCSSSCCDNGSINTISCRNVPAQGVAVCWTLASCASHAGRCTGCCGRLRWTPQPHNVTFYVRRRLLRRLIARFDPINSKYKAAPARVRRRRCVR